jgi:DNA-binding response OmpR family regulator
LKKILIVEDDEDTTELLEVILESAGYSSVSSKTSIPLDELSNIGPDLILLDLYISDGKGSEYCQKIKANPPTGHIPVLIVSAVSGLEKITRDACADGFIAKPFDIEVLQQIIERTIK